MSMLLRKDMVEIDVEMLASRIKGLLRKGAD